MGGKGAPQLSNFILRTRIGRQFVPRISFGNFVIPQDVVGWRQSKGGFSFWSRTLVSHLYLCAECSDLAREWTLESFGEVPRGFVDEDSDLCFCGEKMGLFLVEILIDECFDYEYEKWETLFLWIIEIFGGSRLVVWKLLPYFIAVVKEEGWARSSQMIN